MARKSLKKIQVQALSALLDKYVDLQLSPRFSYAIVMNRAALGPEVVKMQDTVKAFGDYERERLALCEQYAEKDGDGEAILENNVYKGVTKNPEFLDKSKALEESYQERFAEANAALRSEVVEVDIIEVALEDLPSGITPTVMGILMPMVRAAA